MDLSLICPFPLPFPPKTQKTHTQQNQKPMLAATHQSLQSLSRCQAQTDQAQSTRWLSSAGQMWSFPPAPAPLSPLTLHTQVDHGQAHPAPGQVPPLTLPSSLSILLPILIRPCLLGI